MPRAHRVFLMQPTYDSGAKKKAWAGGVHGGVVGATSSDILSSLIRTRLTASDEENVKVE